MAKPQVDINRFSICVMHMCEHHYGPPHCLIYHDASGRYWKARIGEIMRRTQIMWELLAGECKEAPKIRVKFLLHLMSIPPKQLHLFVNPILHPKYKPRKDVVITSIMNPGQWPTHRRLINNEGD